jgi:hypothetical protein
MRQKAMNREENVNKEEKFAREVSLQLADSPRKTPTPENRD